MNLQRCKQLVFCVLLAGLSLFGAIPTGAEGPTTWTWLGGGLLNDITCVDAQTCWAVGDLGLVVHTADGGRTWQLQASDSIANLHHVQFIDRQNGWAIGARGGVTSSKGGYVIRTTDGGVHWQAMDTSTHPELFMTLGDVCFADAQHGWIAGVAYEQLIVSHTTDGGDTWTRTTVATYGTLPLGLGCGSADRVWLVNTNRLYNWTATEGWVERTRLDSRSPTAILFADSLQGWIADFYGTVWRTTDGGATWTPSPTVYGLNGERLRWVAGRLWLAGSIDDWPADRPMVLVSNDAGLTWEAEEVPLTGAPYTRELSRIGLTALSDGTLWLAYGIGGVAHRSLTHPWVAGPQGFDDNSYSWNTLAIVGPRSVAVAGESSSVWRSRTFGQAWWPMPSSPPSSPLNAVRWLRFLDDQVGWALTSEALWRTTDGSRTWASLGKSGLSTAFFVTRENGWGIEHFGHYSSSTVWATTDGGATWLQQAELPGVWGYAVFALDAQHAWIGGAEGPGPTLNAAFYYTTDGGINWQRSTLPEGTVSGEIRQVAFSNPLLGWAAGGRAFRTTDGGQTWASIPYSAYSVALRGESEVWFAGGGGRLHRTTDGGQTWTDDSADLPFNDLLAVALLDDGSAWVAGKQGLIFGLPPTVHWNEWYLPLAFGRSLHDPTK